MSDTGNSRLAQLIQERLDALKWNQERLADESEIPKATLSRIMNGGTLTAKNALKIARVPEMKTTIEELLTLDGNWDEPQSSKNRDVANNLFDQLNDEGQVEAIDYLVFLLGRKRKGVK